MRPAPTRRPRPPLPAGASSARRQALDGTPLAVPTDRAGEALVEIDPRLPAEQLARLVDVRDPHLDVGVVERPEDDLGLRPRQPPDPRREVEDGHDRARVADVED